MEFTFETHYDAKALTLMAKALRKTVRKKRSRRTHLFGWVVIVLGLLLVLSKGGVFDFATVITLVATMIVLLALLFEDRLNGYVAKARLLPGTENAVTVFSESGFTSTTDVGNTQWNYDKIMMIVETDDFFVFLYSQNHAQLYDKRHLQGGTAEAFRRFMEAATGKQIQKL